jgi:hypothetical protein
MGWVINHETHEKDYNKLRIVATCSADSFLQFLFFVCFVVQGINGTQCEAKI